MIKKYLFVLLLFPGLSELNAQCGSLINSGLLPAPGDTIQSFVPYIDSTGAFMDGGFQVGDHVNDFILYDTANAPYQLSQLLATGKPVFLTTGSFTCPAYRSSMDQVLPDLVAMFGTQVIFLNIYTLEAHPLSPDISPLSGIVNVPPQNYADSALLHQHVTYGDRMNAVATSMAALGAPCKVLLDGPGNEYWSAFGPSPNNGYLITQNGWVFSKYGWLHQNKPQAILDINMLLNTTGIIPISQSAFLGVFANPGNEETLATSISDVPVRMEIRAINGQLVSAQTIMPGESFSLGAALRSDGTYIIELVTDERRETIRFVKSR